MRNPEVQAWRDSIPAQDTAPTDPPPLPSPTDWGVTPEEARALLERQMCPVCGEGPWRSPLNHVSRKHGINRHVMRDVCLLSSHEKVTDGEAREKWSRNGQARTDILRANSEKAKGQRGRKPRMTAAFRTSAATNLQQWIEEHPDEVAQLRSGFRERMATPEARAKWEESVRRANAARERSDAEREEFRERMTRPEVVAKRDAIRAEQTIETCTIDGCDRKHVAKGMCKMHWNRERRTGNAGPAGRVAPEVRATCGEAGCERKHYARGMCRSHYEKSRR